MAQLNTESLSSIIALEISKVLHEGKEFNFLQAREEVEELVQFAKDLLNHPSIVRLIPANVGLVIDSKMAELLTTLTEMEAFDAHSESTPAPFVESKIVKIISIYSDLFTSIGWVEGKKLTETVRKDGLTATVGESVKALEEIKGELSEAKQATEAIRGLAGQGSISHYRGVFTKQANSNQNVAKWWFIGGALAMILSIGLLAWVSNSIADAVKEAQSNQAIISLVISKLFMLAIVIFSLQMLMRNYFANMHQATLNRHRENALEVFEAMVKAGTSDETRDAILAFLAKAIFESGDTGFLPGKDMSKDAPDVLQMVRDVSKLK